MDARDRELRIACARAAVAAHRGGGRSAGDARNRADACGIVAAGAGDGVVYVLADETHPGLSPHGWARRAIALWRRLEADEIVAEANQGGDMVRAVIDRGGPDRAGPAVRASAANGPRRAGRRALRARPGQPCRRVSGAGGRNVRLGPDGSQAARRTGSTPWSGR